MPNPNPNPNPNPMTHCQEFLHALTRLAGYNGNDSNSNSVSSPLVVIVQEQREEGEQSCESLLPKLREAASSPDEETVRSDLAVAEAVAVQGRFHCAMVPDVMVSCYKLFLIPESDVLLSYVCP